uniref:Uncharacterized protein n=1 Tax=Paramoeba aparasomata TaxID=2583407 RepID=A0A5P8HBC0_9EUKA|nr:hypothetical protein [Paramoeba aparasomata]
MSSYLNLNQLIKKHFLFNKVQFSSRFGCYNTNYSIFVNKKFMVISLNFLIISLKKMLFITYKVSLFRGIFLTYVSKESLNEGEKLFYNIYDKSPVINWGYGFFAKKRLIKKKEKKNFLEKAIAWEKYQEYFLLTEDRNVNFYLVLTNGLFGFVSNFQKIFLKHLSNVEKEDWPTNYSRLILPNIVFITKNCYNEYYQLFRIFLKKKNICIRTFSLVEEVNINLGYCLSVNDCSKIYDICESLFWLNYIYDKNKW